MLWTASSAVAQLAPEDPWPKFAHDERNSGRAIAGYTTAGVEILRRGPHELPDVRWWYPLSGIRPNRQGGAAIGYLGSPPQRYVVVAANDSRVLLFRFHPASIDCATRQVNASAVITIVLPNGEICDSTPLILPNDQIVIQTNLGLHAYQFGNPPTWCWSEPMIGAKASPSYALDRSGPGAVGRVYAHGSGKLYCLDPDLGCNVLNHKVWSTAQFAVGEQDTGCPAISPSTIDHEGQVIQGPERIVWVGTYNTAGLAPCTACRFHAFLGRAASGVTIQPLLLNADIDNFVFNPELACHLPCGTSGGCCRAHKGAIASPVVMNTGKVIMAGDDGGIYAFDNRVPPINPTSSLPNLRTVFDACNCISCTPATTADGEFFLWREFDGNVHMFVDLDTAILHSASTVVEKGHNQWVYGAPIVGANQRLYFGTPGNPGFETDDDWRTVQMRQFDASATPPFIRNPHQSADGWVFKYTGLPTSVQQPSITPIALDTDGTIVAVNDGYIIALRPTVGDFDGDGYVTNFDIDPFVAALLDFPTWESGAAPAGWGARLRINLLGVGDCNNDGYFNNMDIDCFVDKLVCSDPCGCPQACCLSAEVCVSLVASACLEQNGTPYPGQVCADEPCFAEGLRGGSEMMSGSEVDGADWSYLWETVAWLREFYAE